MPTRADIRRLALALPETHEAPHFDATSFRVAGKIFCTLGENAGGMVIKLSPEDQHNFTQDAPQAIQPVAGYWGRSGWTEVRIEALGEARLETLLRLSWATVAPKRLRKT
jgi:predicted DNA-binding protein (MmcQ/YjbR family)